MKLLYTTTAQVTGGRDGRARLGQAGLELDLVLPPELGGPAISNGTNPEQLFAAGFAACFLTSFEVAARKAGLRGFTAEVRSEVTLGKNDQDAYELTADLLMLVSGLDESVARELMSVADTLCPYSNATRGNILVRKDVQIVTAEVD